ncbi:MAG TPA: GTP cyclohydrolase II [Thermoanaerobaculia bacterium]|jgi:GTP cyclohydrolase II|nr:GTP cyclohydrolase II [Thermoanaerobaculia bacterium]
MISYAKLATCAIYVLDNRAVELSVWGESQNNDEIAVVQHGSAAASDGIATLRIHSACFTGDVLASLRCDCNAQLHASLRTVTSAPWGIIIYPFAHEGRGIGLVNKLRAYNMQDSGLDTFQANRALGFDFDQRNYEGVVSILRVIGADRVRLLTANPQKVAALQRGGVTVVETIPIEITHNDFNERYLKTKKAWFQETGSAISSRLVRVDDNDDTRGAEPIVRGPE